MPTDFKVPDLGENVESGDIVSVLVKEGDVIEPEQNVLEIETGKAVVELPCPHGGRIAKLHVQKGSKVKVGDPLLTIETAGEKAAAPAPAPSAPAAAPASSQRSTPAEVTPSAGADNGSSRAAAKPAARAAGGTATAAPAARRTTAPAGPATRRLARELGVDLSAVQGSGPRGRITEDDVKAAVRGGALQAPAAAAPSAPKSTSSASVPATTSADGDNKDKFGPVKRERMSGIRKAIAVNMAKSHSTIPHVTNFDDADITDLERIRKTGLADFIDPSIKLTMMSFVMKAVAQALKLHPMINASIDMEREEIIYKEYVNLGVAVDTQRGLVVPVMRDVDKLSIPKIAQGLMQMAEQARNNQFKIDDLRGSTFTISNLGAVGGVYSTPIINPPDVAILLVGRSRKLPVYIDDKLEPRLMMPLSLSYDHRLVDGATAARFLNEVIGNLKTPGRMLLAP